MMVEPPLLVASSLRRFVAFFQRAVPPASVHIHRPHFDAVLLRITDDLGGGVEAHRLRVDQGRGEDSRVVALDPCGCVDQKRETRGVRFREAVFTEPLDLLETPLRELL